MMMLPATRPRATQASCRQWKSLVLMGMSMQVYPGLCFLASGESWSSWMNASLLECHIQGGNFWTVSLRAADSGMYLQPYPTTLLGASSPSLTSAPQFAPPPVKGSDAGGHSWGSCLGFGQGSREVGLFHGVHLYQLPPRT